MTARTSAQTLSRVAQCSRAGHAVKARVASRHFSVSRAARQEAGAGGQGQQKQAPQWAWGLAAVSALAVAGSAGLYFGSSRKDSIATQAHKLASGATEKLDAAYYQKVYNAIADSLEEGAENYDDGSFGPVLVRLAWHCSGTYDKSTNNGGSNGATMRFAPEADHGANAGLLVARNHLEKIKKQFPQISYSDLWTLAGVVAVQEMGGPKIPWRPGRQDGLVENCTPDGRLPDGDKFAPHLRDIFYRMGFNDQEIVALSGAHALGRCHPDRSGFEGPWTHSPVSFTNSYFDLLFNEKWQERKWNGPPQFKDKSTGNLMMLRTDIALTTDKAFKPVAKKYAESQDAFFADFSKAFAKLLELGVPVKNWTLEPLELKATGE